MSVQDAVTKVAQVMEDAERRASKTLKDFRALKDEFATIGGEPGAGLVAAAYLAELESAAAQHKSNLLAIHSRMEFDRQRLGLPDSADYSPSEPGEMTTFSGGR